MDFEAKILAIPAAVGFFACVFYVIFGQVTVRKLRKKTATKGNLGIEFSSGWDILNVASALSRPKWLTRKYKASRLSHLVADSDTLYKHTTVLDRILAQYFGIHILFLARD